MLPDSLSNSNSPSFASRSFTGRDILRWSRYVLARNPFYIFSAALLLLSMRLLSGDSRIFTREEPQLLFNFSSFQFYELLLVGTAILLARRKIWYDAGLLVGVETMFVFVPFILVSQALLLENQIAIALCFAGCALAAIRVHGLKRWLANINMPPALLWMGAALLTLNLAFPVLTRLLHQHVTVPAWEARGATLKSWEWNWIMPIAMGLLIFLRAPSPADGKDPSANAAFFGRKCFPLLAFTLWMAGTGAHLYCIGYVYGLPWVITLVAPTAWVAAWMFWLHRDDLDFIPQKFNSAMEWVLLAGPLIVVLLTSLAGDWTRGRNLALLSVVAYGGMALLPWNRRALHLALASAVVALASFSHPLLQPVGIHVGTLYALWISLASYLLLLTMFSTRVRWGIFGGFCLAASVISALPHTASNTQIAIQLGLVFIILHSLRWINALRVNRMRVFFSVLWLGYSAIWMMADFDVARLGTFLIGLTVLAVYFCARGISGQWGPRVIPYTALTVMALDPGCVVANQVPETPSGLLLLIGSFVLFVLGTVAAMTKERWHRNGVVQ